MKKVLIFFLMCLWLMPYVFADITLKTDQDVYNIGNKIRVSASILQNNNFEGLFRLTISCDNYKLEYFLTPVELESHFRTAVNAPELSATSSLLGNCIIIGRLATNNNLIVEEYNSNRFSITDKLSVLPVRENIIALPLESIQINGIINDAFGMNVLTALTKIELDNASYTFDAFDGKFNLTLELPNNIKSEKHTVKISASDARGNSGSSSIEIYITPVPSYVKTEVSKDELLPGSSVEIVASLFDQANDLINASLDLELTSPNNDKVFKKSVQSNEKIVYEFSQYAEPGKYTLVGSYKNLLSQALINITRIREVKVSYENETVFVENIGNVPFEDELTFFLESNLKKYPITKKVGVRPGKSLSIDLSKEVPSGIYDVIVALKEGIEPTSGNTIGNLVGTAEQSLANLLPEKETILADNVNIHDNRPVYKKVATGLSAVSAALVGADGLLARNPVIAPAVLVTIILAIVFHYGKKPIIRLIKRKKEGKEKTD